MQLITPRLVLRSFRLDDFAAVLAMETDPLMQTYERELPAEEEVRGLFQKLLEDGQSAASHRLWYAVTVPPEDIAIGRLKLTLNMPEIREWEIGWRIRRDLWGKGFATEAAQALLRYAFHDLEAHRVVAFCHSQNAASERVMQKLGMTREAHFRQTRWLASQWHDELLYGILESEFGA